MVTWRCLNSSLPWPGYNSVIPQKGYSSTWLKHGGKRCEKLRQEINCQLSVLWMNSLGKYRDSWGKGWRSRESARLPPMWPGFKSRRRRHMWVEIVVGSLPCSERFFIGYSGFPLSLKTNTSKFRFDLERRDTFQRVLMNSVFRG